MKELNFIPYRCEECHFGEYLAHDSTWDCSYGCATDEECEKLFEEESGR